MIENYKSIFEVEVNKVYYTRSGEPVIVTGLSAYGMDCTVQFVEYFHPLPTVDKGPGSKWVLEESVFLNRMRSIDSPILNEMDVFNDRNDGTLLISYRDQLYRYQPTTRDEWFKFDFIGRRVTDDGEIHEYTAEDIEHLRKFGTMPGGCTVDELTQLYPTKIEGMIPTSLRGCTPCLVMVDDSPYQETHLLEGVVKDTTDSLEANYSRVKSTTLGGTMAKVTPPYSTGSAGIDADQEERAEFGRLQNEGDDTEGVKDGTK